MQGENSPIKKSGVWLVVLAAGSSRRMGTHKLLLPLGEESMIRHILKRFIPLAEEKLLVVTNANEPNVKEEIGNLPVVILENDHAEDGMSTSLKLAIKFLIKNSAEAGIILLADQPDVSVDIVRKLKDTFSQEHAPLIQAKYNGGPSHPVLFSHQFFEELLKIEGDQGARNILQARKKEIFWIKVDSAIPRDLDTMDDYKQYLCN